MKQLRVGDRVKIMDGGKDDEGTVLDMDERTEMWSSTSVVILVVGRFTATICGRPGRTDQGPRSVHKRRPATVCSPMPATWGYGRHCVKAQGFALPAARSEAGRWDSSS